MGTGTVLKHENLRGEVIARLESENASSKASEVPQLGSAIEINPLFSVI